MATHLPTDLKWAIAGRSEGKLKAFAEELRQLNPDRVQPGIELARIDKADLAGLARKTKVLISAVGPYHKYGEAAFEACAEAGTCYTDCTGEVPWVSTTTRSRTTNHGRPRETPVERILRRGCRGHASGLEAGSYSVFAHRKVISTEQAALIIMCDCPEALFSLGYSGTK